MATNTTPTTTQTVPLHTLPVGARFTVVAGTVAARHLGTGTVGTYLGANPNTPPAMQRHYVHANRTYTLPATTPVAPTGATANPTWLAQRAQPWRYGGV